MPPSRAGSGPWFYRLMKAMAASRPGAWFFSRVLHHLDRAVLRLTAGRASLSSLAAGLPVVMLSTTGARSGKIHTVPLIGIPDGDRIVVIATNWGRFHYPAWYHNLKANPHATVRLDGREGRYMAREAGEAERASYWSTALRLYPGYDAYSRRIRGRQIPIIVLLPER